MKIDKRRKEKADKPRFHRRGLKSLGSSRSDTPDWAWLALSYSEDDCTQVLVANFFWDSSCSESVCVTLYSALSPSEIVGLLPSSPSELVLHCIRSLKRVPQSAVVEVAKSIRSR